MKKKKNEQRVQTIKKYFIIIVFPADKGKNHVVGGKRRSRRVAEDRQNIRQSLATGKSV